MYTVGEAAERLGLTTHTLRYYEKLGLLPDPVRGGNRFRMYTDGDLDFIRFLLSLKETGMSLSDIGNFVEDGCLLTRLQAGEPIPAAAVEKRRSILSGHLEALEKQRATLDDIIELTRNKLAIYHELSAVDAKSSGWPQYRGVVARLGGSTPVRRSP